MTDNAFDLMDETLRSSGPAAGFDLLRKTHPRAASLAAEAGVEGQGMTDNAFDLMDETLRSSGPAAGFDLLAKKALEDKNYPLLFEVRLLEKRHELGLPLIQVDDSAAMPPETRREYDKAFIDAAREVGGLFLADGNISARLAVFPAPSARPRPSPRQSRNSTPPRTRSPSSKSRFLERVNPYKGFRLILFELRNLPCHHQLRPVSQPRGTRRFAPLAGPHAARGAG